MSARDGGSVADAHRKLAALRSALAMQDAQLVEARAELRPGAVVMLPAAMQSEFERLCVPPERRVALGACDVNDLRGIRC